MSAKTTWNEQTDAFFPDFFILLNKLGKYDTFLLTDKNTNIYNDNESSKLTTDKPFLTKNTYSKHAVWSKYLYKKCTFLYNSCQLHKSTSPGVFA